MIFLISRFIIAFHASSNQFNLLLGIVIFSEAP